MSRARKIHLLRKLKSVRYLKRTGLVLLYVAILTLIMPRNFRLQYQYQVGKSWVEEDLQAAYDYSIFKDPDSLEVERQVIAAEVPDIYVKESRELQEQRVFENLNLFFEKAEVYQKTDKNSGNPQRLLDEINTIFPDQKLSDLTPIISDTAKRAIFWARASELSKNSMMKSIFGILA